jgi:Holliday junction resolvase
MNRKAKGSRNERKSKALLEDWGYKVCKSGGSLGEFDLIGIKKSGIMLVQCKTNRRPDNDELQRILDFEAPDNALKRVHVWIDREKNPAGIDEINMRRILDGEPVEIKPVRSIEDNKRRNNNRSKAADKGKQKTARQPRTIRSVSDRQSDKAKRGTKVRGKRKTARVTR